MQSAANWFPVCSCCWPRPWRSGPETGLHRNGRQEEKDDTVTVARLEETGQEIVFLYLGARMWKDGRSWRGPRDLPPLEKGYGVRCGGYWGIRDTGSTLWLSGTCGMRNSQKESQDSGMPMSGEIPIKNKTGFLFQEATLRLYSFAYRIWHPRWVWTNVSVRFVYKDCLWYIKLSLPLPVKEETKYDKLWRAIHDHYVLVSYVVFK